MQVVICVSVYALLIPLLTQAADGDSGIIYIQAVSKLCRYRCVMINAETGTATALKLQRMLIYHMHVEISESPYIS